MQIWACFPIQKKNGDMFTLTAATNRSQGDDIFFSTHTSKKETLTNNSLQEGNISSALCSTILGTFLITDIGIFCALKTRSSHMMVLFVQQNMFYSTTSQFR